MWKARLLSARDTVPGEARTRVLEALGLARAAGIGLVRVYSVDTVAGLAGGLLDEVPCRGVEYKITMSCMVAPKSWYYVFVSIALDAEALPGLLQFLHWP